MESHFAIREFTDKDFDNFSGLVSGTDGWNAVYNKGNVKVETKWTEESRIKLLRVADVLENVTLDCLYDVLHDPDYRRVWDKDMTDSFDVCKLNDNTIVGWYGAKMPKPLKYRDWCTLRTFRKSDDEFMIFNHSCEHKKIPVRKNYIRSISYVTGYYGKKLSSTSCRAVFITQTDPKGKLPSWFVNYLSCKLSPRVIKKLGKTAQGYEKWKNKNNPSSKPWLNGGDDLPLLDPNDIISTEESKTVEEEEIDESGLAEDTSESVDSDHQMHG